VVGRWAGGDDPTSDAISRPRPTRAAITAKVIHIQIRGLLLGRDAGGGVPSVTGRTAVGLGALTT
jgi:hypothetical protein